MRQPSRPRNIYVIQKSRSLPRSNSQPGVVFAPRLEDRIGTVIRSLGSPVRWSAFDVCLLTHLRNEYPISKHHISNRARIEQARYGQTSDDDWSIELSEAGRIVHGMTRRKFLGTTIAGSATVLAGTIFQKLALAVTSSATTTTFQMGGDLSVNRLGFGAMRLTGQGIWGWPPDRENAKKVLRRAVDLGVNLIDTADAYGPETDELLIAEAAPSLSERTGHRDQGRADSTGPGQLGAKLSTGVFVTMRRQKPQAIETRPDRCLSVAHRRSQGADRGIGRRAESRAGRRKDSARWIIERHDAGNRSGEKDFAHCQRSEPIQHHRPRVGGRAQLLRERKDGILAMGSSRRQWKKFVNQGRESARSRSETS